MSISSAPRLGHASIVVGLLALVLGASLLVAQPAGAEATTIRVPQDHATVQGAVDAASAGDLILIDRGVYNEEVFIGPDHPGNITIRGVDRNEVIFDGEFELGTAIEAQADNVVMENMSARNYSGNGFYWQSVDGFRGSYLTAYRIGVYAIFSFDAVNGVFENSYASGSADAAYYVGQCYPCNITLRNLTAEYSALGYSGTNAGGNLVLEDSLWQNNGTGILPNSLTTEANPPQREATIRNNVVKDNDNANTPAKGLSGSIIGVGIGIAGGNDNVVEGNTVEGHDKYGIAIFPLPEGAQEAPVWVPEGNQVTGNTVSGSGIADLTITAGSGTGNCFSDNEVGMTDPPALQESAPCPDGSAVGSPASATVLASDFAQAQFDNETDQNIQGRASYQDMPDAPELEGMTVEAASEGVDPASSESDQEQDGSALAATGGGTILALLGLALAASGLRLRRRT